MYPFKTRDNSSPDSSISKWAICLRIGVSHTSVLVETRHSRIGGWQFHPIKPQRKSGNPSKHLYQTRQMENFSNLEENRQRGLSLSLAARSTQRERQRQQETSSIGNAKQTRRQKHLVPLVNAPSPRIHTPILIKMAMPPPIVRQPRQIPLEIDVRLPEIQPLISGHEPQVPERPACAWGPGKTVSIDISTRDGDGNIPVLDASIGVVGEVKCIH